MVRTLLACVTMHANGNDEDKVIALKIGGQILAQNAQDAVISRLTSAVSGRFGPREAAPHVTDKTDRTSERKPTPVDKAPFDLGDPRTRADLEGFVANDAKKRQLDSAPTRRQRIDFLDHSDRPENQAVQPGTDSIRPRPKIWDTSTASPDLRDLVAEEAAKRRAEDTARGTQPELYATPADGRKTGPQYQGTENPRDEILAAPKKKKNSGTQSPGTQSPLKLPRYYPGAEALPVAPRALNTKDGFELRSGQYKLVGEHAGDSGADYEQATRSAMPHIASQALGVRVSVNGSRPGAPELKFNTKIGTNPLERVPDASARMRNPDGTEKLVLIESTLDRNFQGFFGRKKGQVIGTAAIVHSEPNPPAQVEYHFISAGEPGKKARATMKAMKEKYPGMKIVWHVVVVPE